MNYYYDHSYELEEEMMEGFAAIFGGVYLLCIVFSIAMYVIRALSVQTIARRRGLNHPWLAWIPVGSDWILGSISDQFKYLTQDREQSRRKILLGVSIAGAACGLATLVMYVAMIVQIVLGGDADVYSDAQLARMIMKPMMGFLLVGLVAAIVGITKYVFQCMCKYDLYKSCDPKNATMFLVLGILFGVTEPFFLLACRKKDLGMPPRRPEPQPWTEREPWENPIEE